MQPDGGWHKSRYSSESANCVEVFWRKSTRSGPYTDNCVEIAFAGSDEVLVRDTKDNGTGPVLKFTGPEWDAFVDGAKDGEFDRP